MGETVTATVTVPVPETRERATVRFSDVSARKLAAWARMMRARYDSAQVTDDNYKHWAVADNLSATAANSAAVRGILRRRSRYEVANNSYAKGIVHTLANHTIGTGPRVQLLGVSRETKRWFRRNWGDWAEEVGFAQKLRTLRIAKCQDGEAFGVLTTNLGLDSPVTLDLRDVEADRVADPAPTQADPRNIDGVLLDPFGNPERYQVLRSHPGDSIQFDLGKFDVIPAGDVGHWFLHDRAGQFRGIPEITPALPLFSQLRRYTLAVIAAAESAADAAGVIRTNNEPDDSEDDPEPMDSIEIEKRMWLTLPKGYDISQIKAEQPTTTYSEFKREVLKEIARCLNMPYNIAAGDSSDYNFASGRLDGQIYVTAVWIDRTECERILVRKILRKWFREARLIDGYLPRELAGGMPETLIHWDGLDFSDQLKIASARDIALKNGSMTLRRIFAEDGYELDEELEAQAEDLGVTVDELKKAIFNRLYTAPAPAVVDVVDPEPPAPPTPKAPPAAPKGRNRAAVN